MSDNDKAVRRAVIVAYVEGRLAHHQALWFLRRIRKEQ